MEILGALLWVIGEVVFEFVAELVVGGAQAVWGHLLDADFDGNGGRLSPHPKLMLLLYTVFGAGAAGAASFFHPAPLAAARWIRITALCLLPLAAGACLAGWERLRRRTGDGRGRAAFWAGLALGVGYVAVRVVLLHTGT